jgi:sortase A
MIVVQGTDHETLKKGPGHYIESGLPGEGALIYVAGHRTTYLAPFAWINNIRVGDYIRFDVPYGTFTYRVFRHYVVPCHPRFFATHRYIVDAKLAGFAARGVTRASS